MKQCKMWLWKNYPSRDKIRLLIGNQCMGMRALTDYVYGTKIERQEMKEIVKPSKRPHWEWDDRWPEFTAFDIYDKLLMQYETLLLTNDLELANEAIRQFELNFK